MLSDINEVTAPVGGRQGSSKAELFPGLVHSRMCLLGHMCVGAGVWSVPPRAPCLPMKVLTPNPAHLAAGFSTPERPCVASTVFPSTEK